MKQIIILLNKIISLLNRNYYQSDYLTPDQAALYLNVSKSQVYKLGSSNAFPKYKPTKGIVYFKKQDLDHWIESGRQTDFQ